MMAKGKKQEKELTRKQVARSRREKQQQKKVFIGLSIVAVLIVGIALAGTLDQFFLKPSRPVAIVNGVSIRTDAYQRRVLYERYVLDTFLQNIQSQLSLIDQQDPSSAFLVQYYQQLANQAQQQRMVVDRQALDDMVDDELVRQKAAELGLTVSQDELNDAIRTRIAGMAGALTEKQATAVASTAVAATATADTFTPTPQPTATPTLTATTVTTTTPTITPEVPTPGPTPTPHVITDDEFNKDYSNYLGILKDQTGFSEAEFRQLIETGLLTDKVRQYFADQVPTEAEQADISDIKVDTEEQAQSALKRLDAGEDFAVVATDVSTDTVSAAKGGELGWYLKDELVASLGQEIADTAFSLEPGKYSQPISYGGAWYIIEVNDRGVHPLDDYQLQASQQQAYSDWLQQARSSDSVKILWKADMAPPDPLYPQSAG
jgi:parvulin-like peptidyl-prolyl isomerase